MTGFLRAWEWSVLFLSISFQGNGKLPDLADKPGAYVGTAPLCLLLPFEDGAQGAIVT
jgi:hypothetical protein